MVTVTTVRGDEVAINPDLVAAVVAEKSVVTLYMAGGWKWGITPESYKRYVREAVL